MATPPQPFWFITMWYLSMDVEATGPFPGLYSLVSIGGVPVRKKGQFWEMEEEDTFYVELQPLEEADVLPAAMEIHGMSLEYLQANGVEPGEAMERFARYIDERVGKWGDVTCAAWPISFDHPYVGWYFQRFLGRNPLGYSGFDTPSFVMGFMGAERRGLRRELKDAGYKRPENPNPHNALADALHQGHELVFCLNEWERSRR